MSKQAIIPITDHNDGDVCSIDYTVKYKLGTSDVWTTLVNQVPVLYGSPAIYVFMLQPLDDDLVYDYEITRNCCDGLTSVAASGSFTSTDT